MKTKNLSQLIIALTLVLVGLSGCKKDDVLSTEPIDAEGSLYPTVVIGNRTWFAKNLKTAKYRNGDNITMVVNASDWETTTSGAIKAAGVVTNVGYLYNYAALSDTRGLCPNGWHIATTADFEDLKTAAGGGTIAGYNLKTNTSDWAYPNELNVNTVNPDSLKFAALPNGYIQSSGIVLGENTTAAFWTTTETSATRVKSYELYSNSQGVSAVDSDKKLGLSCRCVKD
jgi:uncharacterized protein (TIGR02145 family)